MSSCKKKGNEARQSTHSRNFTNVVGGIVPEAGKKPVRTKPMRGPGATDKASGSSMFAPPPLTLRATTISTSSSTTDSTSKSTDGLVAATSIPQPQLSPAQEQAKLKEDFCVQLLVGGFVQSFVDLFYLTHQPDNALDVHSTDTSEHRSVFEKPEMEFLRDQLITAEHCKRRGEIPNVLHAYESLATYFSETNDMKTMNYFYEECLNIARLMKDPMCEMKVLSQIGNGYYQLQDLSKARDYHEQHVAIAQVMYEHEDDALLRAEAFMQLGRVYFGLAGTFESRQSYEDAIDYYKKYLDCASKANDADSIGEAQFKIGMCYNKLLRASEALPFLEAYLVLCRNAENHDGEGKACAELAIAHEINGNMQVSIDFLNHYAAISTKSDNMNNQADACRRLGHIYTASQDFVRAREMHEKNYELTPAVVALTKDPTAMNTSRINVGAARANDRLALFLLLVKDDFRGLLEWKNTRTLPTAD